MRPTQKRFFEVGFFFMFICDQLKGKYPKTFVWTGWHPNDLCYKIPILKTEEEFWEWDGRSEATTESVNEVKDVPEGFKRWIDNNIHRAKSWDSAPYFIRDNDKYIREDFKVNVYNKTEKTFVCKRIEAQRAAMTPEERAGWDEADRAVFERWQDEANTNMYLDGIIDEDEDPDFNPFRKDDK